MFHSIKTALPTFEAAEGSSTNENLVEFGLKNGTNDSMSSSVVSTKNALGLRTSNPLPGAFEIQLDMTAEEMVWNRKVA